MTITIPARRDAGASTGRIPTSPPYTASPIRHSPLSQPPMFAPTRTPSPSQQSRKPHPSHAPMPGSGHKLPSDSTGQHRRTSLSTSPLSPATPSSLFSTRASPSGLEGSPTHPASPPLSRSHPLLGSYPLSLLHSRMSHAHPAHPPTDGFCIQLSSVGRGRDCPADLRLPKREQIPFSATHYSLVEDGQLSSGVGGKSSPWVGNVDLESHYIDSLRRTTSGHHGLGHGPPPLIPGYQVAPRGQLQIFVRTATTALKVFLIPYDLSDLDAGGRLLIREKTYARDIRSEGLSSSLPQTLRYAIQLQFACVQSPNDVGHRQSRSRKSSTSRRPRDRRANREAQSTSVNDKAYYLSKSIRLIFSSLSSSREEIRMERHVEVIPPPLSTPAADTPTRETRADQPKKRRDTFGPFSPGSLGRLEEWEMIRAKWFARREMEDAEAVEDEDGPATRLGGKVTSNDDQMTLEDSPSPSISRGRALKTSLDLDPHTRFTKADPRPPKINRTPSLLSTTQPARPFSPSSTSSQSSPLSPDLSLPTAQFGDRPAPQAIISPTPRHLTLHSPRPIPHGRAVSPISTSPRPASPRTPVSVWSPVPTQRRMTREDGREEVELSQRLRQLSMRGVDERASEQA
ncbi:hypothetical protein IAU60_003420 [Kwoniella sp. DSM 27419]